MENTRDSVVRRREMCGQAIEVQCSPKAENPKFLVMFFDLFKGIALTLVLCLVYFNVNCIHTDYMQIIQWRLSSFDHS